MESSSSMAGLSAQIGFLHARQPAHRLEAVVADLASVVQHHHAVRQGGDEPHVVLDDDEAQRRIAFAQALDVGDQRSEEHTSELQSQSNLVCRLLLEKKKNKKTTRCTSLRTTGVL